MSRNATASIQMKVAEFIKRCGALGVTADATQAALALTHQTCSARINELAKAGIIIDSGRKRPTRTGRKARIYVHQELWDASSQDQVMSGSKTVWNGQWHT